jgi:hypothetical protein
VFRQCFAISCLFVAALVPAAADTASNVVQYTYDAAGNIVAIRRVNPAPVTLSGFAPASGPAGTPVTIAGTGFSATAAQNAVSFNGVAAAVTAAAATTLAVTVPMGATTGKVAVTVAGNAAASATDFVVTAPGAPAITSFAPASGAPGMAVSVTGANFNAAAGGTTVKLNQNAATVSSVTPAALTFAVPAATGSGKIRVTTATGSADSLADFIVPPGGVAASDILATARLAADSPPQAVGLYATNKYGLVLFEGAAGAWMSLHVGNFAVTPASSTIGYTIYKPDNTQLVNGTLGGSSLSIHLPSLPLSGTYSLLLRTGLAQVSFDAKLETNRFIPTDAPPLEFARAPGQSTRALIAGTAGEQKAFMVSGLSISPSTYGIDVSIALPSGPTFRKTVASGLGTTTLLPPFAVTGTHPVTLVPPDGTTQSSYKVSLLQGASMQADGAPADVVIANPGEAARLTFAGVAGENLGLGVSGVSLVPAASAKTNVAAYKPDGSLLVSTACAADGTPCAANLENLPATGTYTIIVQPAQGQTGAQRLWLSRDAAATLASGTPLNLALARPGQNARLTFPGTAGAMLALQVRGVVTNPAGQGLLVQVKQPDKSLLVYAHLTGAGQTLVAPPLPITGTYTVFIEPEPAGAATATTEVLVDPGRPLEIDGAIQGMAIGVPGGSARLDFSASAGQNLGLGITDLALNPNSGATLSIYKPDGAQLGSYSCSGNCGATLLGLPATGRYAAVVRPSAYATGSMNVTLSTEVAGVLTVGGPPLALNSDRAGRNARLAFAGSAGQLLRVSWSGVTAFAGYTTLTVTSPTGAVLGSGTVLSNGSGAYDVPALPTSGNYTLLVDPPLAATLNATVRILPR